MATDVAPDPTTYLLKELPENASHAVIAPAWRWRALFESTSFDDDDPLVVAVTKLVVAKCEIREISDLLQLPYDLVEYLTHKRGGGQYSIDETDRVARTDTKVGWVYRDLLTDELVRATGRALPPVNLSGRGTRVRFGAGSAGSPRAISGVKLRSNRPQPSPPTSVDLARLRPTTAVSFRVSLIAGAERCLLVHPVTVVEGEVVALDANDEPHHALSRALDEQRREDGAIADWVKEVMVDHAERAGRIRPAIDSPLTRAAGQLARSSRDLRESRSPAAATAVKADISLVLRRYCAEAWYRAEIDPTATPRQRPTSDAIGRAFGIDKEAAARLLGAHPPTFAQPLRDVVQLLIDCKRMPARLAAVDTAGLAEAACELGDLADTDGQHERLERLIRTITDLVEGLLRTAEESRGIESR